jgi:hypothetical protein
MEFPKPSIYPSLAMNVFLVVDRTLNTKVVGSYPEAGS